MQEEYAPQFTVRLPLGAERPWATWVLLGINILTYLATVIISIVVLSLSGLPIANFLSPIAGVLHLAGWKENSMILQGEYWRLITAMFLHGGLMHILFNSIALYALGGEAERIYGTKRFLGVYFVSGLAGSIASYAFSPAPSVGASGAIFGIIGALAVFFYTTRSILGEIGKRQLQSMIGIIVINIIIGLSAQGIIDNYAHMGGLAGGIVIGWLLVPRYILNKRFWPPVLERRLYAMSWVGVIGFLLVASILVVTIQPPL